MIGQSKKWFSNNNSSNNNIKRKENITRKNLSASQMFFEQALNNKISKIN
jgi:hypothetical protein